MSLPNIKKRQVNLLPRDPFEKSLLGIVFAWALSFGKWAVIVTQLLVTGVFLARFGYDRQLTDLRKEIAKQTAIINSYSQIEQDYTLAQRRLSFVSPAVSGQETILKVVEKLQNGTPVDVWFERLSISPTSTSIVANAGSLAGFSQFVQTLSSEPMFGAVTINNLQDGAQQSARLKFDISMNYGTKKK